MRLVYLVSFVIAACASPQTPAPVAPALRNAADILITAEQPDQPHGAVGAQMAFLVDVKAQALIICYSTDGKHSQCGLVGSWAPAKPAEKPATKPDPAKTEAQKKK